MVFKIILFGWILSFSSLAVGLHCEDPVRINQTGKDTKIAVSGEIGGIAKKIVGAGIGVEVDTKVKDLLHRYPNVDKLILETRLSYEICKSIQDLKDVSDKEKINLYLQLKGRTTIAFSQKITVLEPLNYCESDNSLFNEVSRNRIYKHNEDGTIMILKNCFYANYSLSCDILVYNCSDTGLPNSVRLHAAHGKARLIATHMQLPFSANSISIHGKTYSGNNPKRYPSADLLPGRKIEYTLSFRDVTNKINIGIDKIEIPFKTKSSNGTAIFTDIKLN